MTEIETRYQDRLARYVTAMRNEKPDRVPIRPLLAEFTANVAGYTCQDITHDYDRAFAAVMKTADLLDVDALVANMVWVWTGLTEGVGLKYYAAPGIHISPDVGFQYREPPEHQAWMKADEYDALIDDPTGFLLNTWLPRVATPVCETGSSVTAENNLSFLRGGMSMMAYFRAVDDHVRRMRTEAAMPSAIAGILKAPMDILADKLRGYLGLLEDLERQPSKVLEACEALAPHLYKVALDSSDPDGNAPIGFWMHRGCVPFINPKMFDTVYWPTLRPIIEELWSEGRQTLFYAEGNWDYHLDRFATLPERSIVFHVDKGDLIRTHRKLGQRFCISGGVPNTLLSFGTPEDVRECCRTVIKQVAGEGGFIMDACAIVQNDARIENVQAMVESTHEYGIYSSGAAVGVPRLDNRNSTQGTLHSELRTRSRVQPGVCTPWDSYRQGLEDIPGDEDLVRKIWNDVDGLANMYVWQLLESF